MACFLYTFPESQKKIQIVELQYHCNNSDSPKPQQAGHGRNGAHGVPGRTGARGPAWWASSRPRAWPCPDAPLPKKANGAHCAGGNSWGTQVRPDAPLAPLENFLPWEFRGSPGSPASLRLRMRPHGARTGGAWPESGAHGVPGRTGARGPAGG